MKNFISAFLTIVLLLSFAANIFAEGNIKEYSWYVKRNVEHLQPNIDSNMQFIEKYNGYYVNKNFGNTSNEKVIYLTFDAGYENGNIEIILDTLKEEKVSAAFFILNYLILKNPELVKRMSSEGHSVCNHTYKHTNITKYKNKEELKQDLEMLEESYKNLTGRTMEKYFRPPEGRFNEESIKYLSELGYKTVFWSFAYADWDNNAQLSNEKAKEKIFQNIHNGAILLLHPTSKTNASILKDVINELRSQGYRFGTLEEL